MEYSLIPEWVLLTAFLVLKSVMQSFLQVWVRIRFQLYATGEDKKLFYRFRMRGEVDKAAGKAKLERYEKLWQNDLEGIPLFLLIALGYSLLGGDEFLGGVYFLVYAIARSSYSLCYIKGLQPWRGISWDSGLVTTLALTIHSITLAYPLMSA